MYWYNSLVRKVVIFFILVLIVAGMALLWIPHFMRDDGKARERAVILKVGLVADSHNDNDLLAKALRQAQGLGADFVIGLGDYTDVGTTEELAVARKVFADSGLEYFVTAGDHDLWAGRDQQLRGLEGSQGNIGNGSNEGSEGAKTALDNFRTVFGEPSQVFDREKVQFVILDNSDIYFGISQDGWEKMNSKLKTQNSKLTFVFAHKTPFHPDSAHVMGEQTPAVATQAKQLIELIEAIYPCHSDPPVGGEESTKKKQSFSSNKILRYAQDDKKCPAADGFFSGDLHFFANFLSPGQSATGGNSSGSVKMTTIGAVDADRNFQGPRFGLLTIYDDYSWEVEDIEIR